MLIFLLTAGYAASGFFVEEKSDIKLDGNSINDIKLDSNSIIISDGNIVEKIDDKKIVETIHSNQAQSKFESNKNNSGSECFDTRVIRSKLYPSPELDFVAIKEFRRILEKDVFPTRKLLQQINDNKSDLSFFRQNQRAVLLVFATHPDRMNIIRNLIFAAKERYLIVVVGDCLGEQMKKSCIQKESFRRQLAAFVFDGVLEQNREYLSLPKATVGLSLAKFEYGFDTEGFGFCLSVKSACEYTHEPVGRIKNVIKSGNSVIVEYFNRNDEIVVANSNFSIKLVSIGEGSYDYSRVTIKLIINSQCEIRVNTSKSFSQIKQENIQFRDDNTLFDFETEENNVNATDSDYNRTVKTLYQRCKKTIYETRLKISQSKEIKTLFELCAYLVSGFESVLPSVKLNKESEDLGLLIRKCIIVYRQADVDGQDVLEIFELAKKCRSNGGLYRAVAFRLVTLISDKIRIHLIQNDTNNKSFSFLLLSLASDENNIYSLLDMTSQTEKELFLHFLSKTKAPSMQQMLQDFDKFTEFGVLAVYFYIRVELLGIIYKDEKLFYFPKIQSLKNLVIQKTPVSFDLFRSL